MKMEKIEVDQEVHFDDCFVRILKIELEGILCGVSSTPAGVERPDVFGLDVAIHPSRFVPVRFDYSQGIRAVFSHSRGLQHFHLPFSTNSYLRLQDTVGQRIKFAGESGILLHSYDKKTDIAKTLCSRSPDFMAAARHTFPDFYLDTDPRFAGYGHCHCIKKYSIERIPSALARWLGATPVGVAGYGGMMAKNSMEKLNKAREEQQRLLQQGTGGMMQKARSQYPNLTAPSTSKKGE